jgi:hypothetical protein
VPLARGKDGTRYHDRPCRRLAKLVADRDRAQNRYRGDGKYRPCANTRNGVHNAVLIWSRTHPIGYDAYLSAEAVLCGESCFVEFYDDRPYLPRPEAYFLIRDVPEPERPVLERITEVHYGSGNDDLISWLVNGESFKPRTVDYGDGHITGQGRQRNKSGHRHEHGLRCSICRAD